MENAYLDSQSFKELLNLLKNLNSVDKPGFNADMNFLFEDCWLKDTAVNENIVQRKGMWEIHLVFAHHQDPKKLIKRVITGCTSKRKAEMTAQYMRRLAAKDARGTLKIDRDDFGLCAS